MTPTFSALLGVMFKGSHGAAFSQYRLWESAGFMAAFAYQSHLCLPIKAYILLAVLGLGMAGYITVEYGNQKNNESAITKKVIIVAEG